MNYFTTDWQNYSGASGFVFNMGGYVLGTLTHKIRANEENIIPCFVTLCTLEDELNKLLNGGRLVNFGVYAKELPGSIKNAGTVKNGIYLNQVVGASPAYNAGLRVGDVITSINGEEITDMIKFMDVLSNASTGQVLTVTYMRSTPGGFRELTANVLLSSR